MNNLSNRRVLTKGLEQQLYLRTTDLALLPGTPYTTTLDTRGLAAVSGTVISNVALTITFFQGPTNTTVYPISDVLTTGTGVTDGNGSVFDIKVLDSQLKITISGASAPTTFFMSVNSSQNEG